MFYVISYDITHNRRRTRICNELKNYGKHIQYSVFECDLNSAQLKELKNKLNQEINKKKDSIRYYAICNTCFEKIERQGVQTIL
ncbi:MAG: CRISPR-associated endonuclease Cas2 [Bacteroidales bacterium]|nr:CRISPR-associated endonuclease Cas2 [Bacteroidales bacterium]